MGAIDYQKLRISDMFKREWQELLEKATSTPSCPIFYQYVTDFVFRKMIKQQYPIERVQNTESEVFLTTDDNECPEIRSRVCAQGFTGKVTEISTPTQG